MGMYDNIRDQKMSCPYCGAVFGVELQTKDYACELATIDIKYDDCDCMGKWKFPHNHPKTNARYVRAIGTCQSPLCRTLERARDFITMGYISGFGRAFQVRYKTNDAGIAVGPGEIHLCDKLKPADLKNVEWLFAEVLAQAPKEYSDSFKKTLDASGGNWAIAIMSWYFLGSDNRREWRFSRKFQKAMPAKKFKFLDQKFKREEW